MSGLNIYDSLLKSDNKFLTSNNLALTTITYNTILLTTNWQNFVNN